MADKHKLDDVRELVESCLADTRASAEGYPVEPLLRDMLDAFRQGPRAREHTLLVMDTVLAAWIGRLDRDMQSLLLPTPAVQLTIRSRMRAAQLALIGVRQMLGRLRLWCQENSETTVDA